MNVENVKHHCIGSENLKETLYFYEGILGIKPSLEKTPIRYNRGLV